MNKRSISLGIFLSLFCVASFACLPAGRVSAQSISNPLSAGSFGALLTKIAQGVGALVGGVGVIMLIIAGIMFLLSAGNPNRMATAKVALTYAIIGMVIGLIAEAIVAAIKNIIGA